VVAPPTVLFLSLSSLPLTEWPPFKLSERTALERGLYGKKKKETHRKKGRKEEDFDLRPALKI
jgi:hypothetical protein